jgi:hypothetical protein
MDAKCSAITKEGVPCKGRPTAGRKYCMSHDPELAQQRAEGNRRGGEARANARRTARQWAAVGEQVNPEDLPLILRACMVSVQQGELEPSQATAIANLAKASVTITNELQLEERIKALEEAAGLMPSNVRKIA